MIILMSLQVFLVTGGYSGSGSYIDTTEVLRVGVGDNAWTYVGNFPRAMNGLMGVNLGNRLFMTGTDSIDKIVV